MKLVLISDTHARHRKVNVPDGDILVHAGDVTITGEFRVLEDFHTWLGELPHKHKIVIPGNHDFGAENWHKLPFTNGTLLLDEAVTVEGLKFYGSPFTPTFFDWAFMLPRGKTIYEKWLQIPHDTDVLITHGPPYGILDWAPYSKEHAGCHDLRNVVDAIRPKLHVFGHIHAGYGQHLYGEDKQTLFVNASVVNEAYQPVNQPIVVEL